jgi:hypothetical protein
VRVVIGITVLLGAIGLATSGIAAQERHITTFPPVRIDPGGSSLKRGIEHFTGKNPKACGSHTQPWRGYEWRGQASNVPPEQDADLVKLSLKCAEDASHAKLPFETVKIYEGVDSRHGIGLLGQPDGSIYLFSFDAGGEDFSARRCLVPIVRTSQGAGTFDCETAVGETWTLASLRAGPAAPSYGLGRFRFDQ